MLVSRLRLGLLVLMVVALSSTVPVAAQSDKFKPSDDETPDASENSWESDFFGTVVTWQDPWLQDSTSEPGAGEDKGWDYIHINIEAEDAIGYVSIYTEDFSAEAPDAEAFLDNNEDEYSDPDSKEEFDDVEIFLSERTDESLAIGYVYTSEDTLYYEVYEWVVDVDSDTATWAVMLMIDDGTGDYLESAQDSITVNGEVPFTLLDLESAIEAIQEMSGA